VALIARSRWLLVITLVAALALLATMLIEAGPARTGPALAAAGAHFEVTAAQSANGPIDVGNGNKVGGAIKHDTSKPIRELPQLPVRALPANDDQGGDAASGGAASHVQVHDPVVQTSQPSANMPSPSLNFEGIDFPGVSCNCAPPDTNGEVGATQYVQIVNEGYQVFNKSTGASMLGPASIESVWAGFGGVCQSNGDGDPVVLYDQLANRWLLSQFAGSGIPTDECVAVSATSDATGVYYRYDFHLGSNFYDYPKISVWPDGYYMAINVFDSSGSAFLGPQAFVLDRSKMLTGAAATFIAMPNLGSSYSPMLPADLEGSTLPPAGAPDPFVLYPSAGIPVNGKYLTYRFHADFVTPANSTFTQITSPNAAPFTQACGACVTQPGTTSALDTLGDRLMFRLTYRNFGDHDMLLGSYTVASGGTLGVRWFELRSITSGTESVFQEGTYQPDSTYRWMPSAAMDKAGDIAVGYSASSSSVDPSLRYAGRLVGDPAGVLAQGEAVLFAGLGSQSGTSSRWGDYSDMTVDPVDGCTFWFTSEYYPSGVNQFDWRTRIGSFSFPSCSGVAQVLTSVGVTPANASVTVSKTQQFSATGYDQFGQPMSPQPTFTWSVNGGGSINASTGLFTAGGTPGGPFTVTAASGGVSGTASVTVTSPPPDFSFTVTPPSTSVKRGGTATYTITITKLNGFTGAITFSLGGKPSGSTVTFSPNPTTATTTTVTLTVKTATSTTRKTYTLTINGVSGSLSHSQTVTLTVTR